MWRRMLNRLRSKSKHFDIATANGHTLGAYTGNGVYRQDLRGQTLFAIEFSDAGDIDEKTGMIDLDDGDYATISETKKKMPDSGEEADMSTDGELLSGEDGGNNNNDDVETKEPLYATVVKRNETEEKAANVFPANTGDTDACREDKHAKHKEDTNPVMHNEDSPHTSSNGDDVFNFKPEDADFDIAEMLQEALKNTEEKDEAADSSSVPNDHGSTGDDSLQTFPRAGFVRKMVTFNQTSVEIERPVSIAVACPRVPGWTPDDDEAATPAEKTDPDVVSLEEHTVPERRVSTLSGDSATVETTDTEDDEVSSLSRGAAAKKRVTFEDDCVSLATDSDLYSDYGDEGENGLKVPRMKLRRTAAVLLAWVWMGLLAEIPGPTLPYWMHRLNGTYEGISRSYLTSGSGVFLGAVLAAIFIGWCIVSIDIAMATSLLLATCSVVVTPWCSGLVLLASTAFVAGLSRGLMTVVGIVYVYRLWDSRRASVVLHLLYVSFSVGAALAPYLARPFTDDAYAAATMTYLQQVGLHDVIATDTNGHNARDHGGDVSDSPLRAYSVQDAPVRGVDSHPIMVLLYSAVGLMMSLLALSFFALHVTAQVQTRRRLDRHRKIQEERQTRRKSDTGSDAPTKKRKWRIPSYTGTPLAAEQTRKDSLFSFSSTDLDVGMTDTSDDEDKDNGLRLLALISKKGRKQNGVVGTTPPVDNGDVKSGGAVEVASLTCTSSSSGASGAGEGTWFLHRRTADVPMLMYLYVFFALSGAVEYVFATFVTAFALDNERPSASHVVAVFWASSAVSRLAYIAVSKCLPPNFIVIGNLTVSTFSSAVLALYGGRYTAVLYLFTALLGASVGPITPGGFTWANAYLTRSAKSTALACSVAAAGLTLFPWLVAFLVDYFGTSVMLHTCTACGVASVLFYLPVMNRLGSRKVFKKRIRRRNDFVYSNSQKDYV